MGFDSGKLTDLAVMTAANGEAREGRGERWGGERGGVIFFIVLRLVFTGGPNLVSGIKR